MDREELEGLCEDSLRVICARKGLSDKGDRKVLIDRLASKPKAPKK